MFSEGIERDQWYEVLKQKQRLLAKAIQDPKMCMMKLFFAKIVNGLELFCESNEPVGYFRKKLQAVNYLRKKTPSQIFHMFLNMPQTTGQSLA